MPETISYTLIAPGFGAPNLLLRSDSTYIPCDLGNMDYQQFLAWLAEGNPAPEGWSGPTNDAPT